MASTANVNWERLKTKCEEAGLPSPVLYPSPFAGKTEISITQEEGLTRFRATGETMEAAIDKATVYVWGYQNALNDVRKKLCRSIE